MTTYAMSGKVTPIFDAPTGWFVRQSDAGGASSVVVREFKDSDDQTVLSIHQPWPSDDETQNSYEAWLAKESLGDSTGQREIGSLTFDMWQQTAEPMTVYTAVLDQEAPYYVLIQVSEAHEMISSLFLDSIVFSPIIDQFDEATRVPEWSVEDTQ